MSVTLEPDDDSSRALAEMEESRSPGFTHLVGLISPGSYKVHVRGPLNLYELAVSLTDVPLTADQFEPNESFETSTRFPLLEPGATSVIVVSITREVFTISLFIRPTTRTSSGLNLSQRIRLACRWCE